MNKGGVPYLIASAQLETTNSQTTATFVNDSLARFFVEKPFSENLLLLVTEAAPYMVLAGRNLKTIYSMMTQVTCILHGMHRICEHVRESLATINQPVSWARKVFLKCPTRISIYKEIMQCALPPDVVVSRWGTWLTAVLFFADNFEKFGRVVETLTNDSKYADKLKTLFAKKTSLETDLAFIRAYLSFLPAIISRNWRREGFRSMKNLKLWTIRI